MDPNPEIRAARVADHAALLALWLDLVEYHRRLSPDFPLLSGLRDVIASEIRRGIARDNCRLLVADDAGRLVGFVFAEIESGGVPGSEPAPAWIHELWVEPEARGRGVAARLLAEVDAFLASRGVRRVSVRVEGANEAGQSFWARRGFGERARILERAT